MALRSPALLLVLFSVAAVAAAGEARFMSYPDVRGDRIVFAWEADLYTVGIEGGTAVRLTSHPAGELAPKFSPDGKWIAYTTFNNGVFDVWVMPSEGGAPTRLTWPPLGGQVVAWTPDSRHVVFRSRWGVPPAARDQKLYQVALDATMPDPLPLDRAQSASYSPDGSKMLYVRKGNEDYYWKRYKGGQYTDIWMDDFAGKELQAGDRLRGPQRLPDVGGRHDVLQLRPLARRHHQPVGAGPRRPAPSGRSRRTPTST